MTMVVRNRACAILYDFLLVNCDQNRVFILPANICHDVLFIFLKARIPVRFSDLEEENLGLDLECLQASISDPGVQGILYNHTYGNEHTPIQQITRIRNMSPDMWLIDDRCLCNPETGLELTDPAPFDIVLFSTGRTKQVDVSRGGFALLGRRTLYESKPLIFSPAAYDRLKAYYAKTTCLDEDMKQLALGEWLNAGEIGLKDIVPYFKEIREKARNINSHREQLNSIYEMNLPPSCILGNRFNGWRFQIRIPNKNAVLQEIFSQGLFASGHYESIPAKFRIGECPVAEALHRCVVNLFNDFNFTVEQCTRIVEVLKAELPH